jgi:hypothetical protein
MANYLEYAFLGGGAMASAIIRGLLAAKLTTGECVGVSDIHQPSLDNMTKNIPGLFTTRDNIVRRALECVKCRFGFIDKGTFHDMPGRPCYDGNHASS